MASLMPHALHRIITPAMMSVYTHYETPMLMWQVPEALPRLQQLTHMAYTGGFPGGGTSWLGELLASTATLTGLRSLHLACSSQCGSALAEALQY